MSFSRIVLMVALCYCCYGSKAQRHITVPELIKLAHSDLKKIDSAAFARGFNKTYAHVYYEGTYADYMQINKPVAEGKWAVKRELMWSQLVSKHYIFRSLDYVTTDYMEFAGMIDWLAANGYKEYKPAMLKTHFYSNGKNEISIEGEKVENHQTGEVVYYYFSMKTEFSK